jgi:hypothetical protein
VRWVDAMTPPITVEAANKPLRLSEPKLGVFLITSMGLACHQTNETQFAWSCYNVVEGHAVAASRSDTIV